MGKTSIALLALAIALEAFAYWGMSTASGEQVFDEMNGLIPFSAAILGAALALCAMVLGLIALRRAAGRDTRR